MKTATQAILREHSKEIYSFSTECKAKKVHKIIAKNLKPEYVAGQVQYLESVRGLHWYFEVACR